jgi:Chlorophyll A-B binding protein
VVTRLWIFPIPVTAWTAHNQNVRHHTPTKTQLQASRWNEVPVAIQDELGCSPTLTLLLNQPEPFFFDPFNLATDETFAIYREAELKHGRVAMVSVVSCIFSTLVNEVAKANQAGTLEKLWSSILASLVKTPGAANPALPRGEVVVKVPVNPQQQLIPIPSPLSLLQEWSVWDYLRMIVVCGIIETFVWVQIDAQDMPGDYQVGYWGVRDKGLHERSLICELENGRLAMIVMLYYILVDVWKVFGPAMLQQLSAAAEK